jgi:hypothetical protein
MSEEKTSIIQNTIYKVETKELCMREGCEIIEEHYNKITNQRAKRELENVCNRTDKGSILEEYLIARIEQLKQD